MALPPVPPALPGGEALLEQVFELAKQHGVDSEEPDHEVGDLQDALRRAWHWLNPLQQQEVLNEARAAREES